jgi:hypothetical protein
LQEELRPILLRRMKEDVETLPEKEEVSGLFWLLFVECIVLDEKGHGPGQTLPEKEEVRRGISWVVGGTRSCAVQALVGRSLQVAWWALHSYYAAPAGAC